MVIFVPWGGKKPAVIPTDFEHALTQEVLRTELIRIKALIGTVVLLSLISGSIFFFAPDAVIRLWHGNLNPLYLYAVVVPFILFELWVHAVISRHLEVHHDIPKFRRYLSAFIETSMPTAALALQINSMGSEAALGFVGPFIYFIFIILSTLRLDFWLSTFTGFVAAA
jgi:adenylate cyclase